MTPLQRFMMIAVAALACTVTAASWDAPAAGVDAEVDMAKGLGDAP